MLSSVKDILTKEVDVKKFLEMEIELTKIKQLLATEIKLKEFLVQEIDLKSFLSKTYSNNSDAEQMSPEKSLDSGSETNTQSSVEEKIEPIVPQIKRNLPAHDFSLIDDLIAEHKKIRFIFNQVMSLAIKKDYVKVSDKLELFNAEIREHYHKADTELYAYLKTYVQIKYPKREKAFTQLSLEMKNLSIEIYYIISQSPNIPFKEETRKEFIKEFMTLGKLLNERINKEQTVLFKMYQQTNAAKSIS